MTATCDPAPGLKQVLLHRHSGELSANIMDQNHYQVLKAFESVAFKYPAEIRDILFKA